MTHPQITDRLAQNVAQQKSKEADLADRKLSVEEFAHWSGLSVSTANKMRLNGTGPRYVKFGRRVLYDPSRFRRLGCEADAEPPLRSVVRGSAMTIVIPKKTKPEIAKSVESAQNGRNAAPSPKMDENEFAAMIASDRQKLKDAIDRPTAAALLGIAIRTLLRWHDQNYGPKRIWKGGPIRYSRAEVEAWIADYGQGSHRPRSSRNEHSASFARLVPE
jgi:predicted DNA-binding transcriptional regulator AlpA